MSASAGPTVSVVVGNPRPGSRTAAAATAVGRRIAAELGAGEPAVFELAEHAARIFDPEDEELRRIGEAVAASTVCVAASPTYKATYTGLLKAFFDRYRDRGLAGVVAIPFMVGGAPQHALAPEIHLRALLAELGATTPGRALFVTEAQLADLDPALSDWAGETMPVIRRLAGR